jgi:hypothetical protein
MQPGLLAVDNFVLSLWNILAMIQPPARHIKPQIQAFVSVEIYAILGDEDRKSLNGENRQ